MTGRAWKPRPIVDPATAASGAAPRKMNAAGIVISPPRHTSQNSFAADAVSADSATSSVGFR